MTIFDGKGTFFVYLPQELVPFSYTYGATFTKRFTSETPYDGLSSFLAVSNPNNLATKNVISYELLVYIIHTRRLRREAKPLPFYVPFLTEKLPFCIPFPIPMERLLKFSLEKSLKYLDESAFGCVCEIDILKVPFRTQKTVFPTLFYTSTREIPIVFYITPA